MSNQYNTRQTLLAKLKDQHDQRSWEEFVALYERYIYLVIYNVGVPHNDVDDLAQKVLLKLWKSLPDFDYQPGKCKFRTWMTTVIKNSCYNYFRTKQSYDRKLDSAANENTSTVSMPDVYELAEKNWKEHISNLAWENIKDNLAESNRKSFLMMAEGKSVDEISKALGLKANAIYVIRKRVIEKLSREIRRLENDLN